MQQLNVLGEPLQDCSTDPITGYYRTGCCENHGDDPDSTWSAVGSPPSSSTFSAEHGNDLSTPMPQFGFAGLAPGDQWCVCAARWAEALSAGAACPVVLEALHISALEFVDLADLRAHAHID